MWGGLGNQLYSVFATAAYARRHGMAFHFAGSTWSIRSGEDRSRPTYWRTLLSGFGNHVVSEDEQVGGEGGEHKSCAVKCTTASSRRVHLMSDDREGGYLPMPPPPPSGAVAVSTLHWQIGSFLHFDAEAPALAAASGLLSQRDYACAYLKQHFLPEQGWTPELAGGVTGDDLTVSLHFR
jgi:hypothetical protein